MNQNARNILFFDSRAEGHHSEYVQHLVQYATGRPELGHLHFVYPSALSTYGPSVVEKIEGEPHFHLYELSEEEKERIDSAPLLWRSFVEWTVVRRYVRHVQADHCVLLELNIFQLALGLVRMPSQVEISGILFFPYPRIEPDGSAASDRLLCWLEKLRKHLQLRWMLGNQSVGTIFLFNDRPSVEYLNQFWPDRRPFRMLPDPVPPLVEGEPVIQREGPHESSNGAMEEKSGKQLRHASQTETNTSSESPDPDEETLRPEREDRTVFLMFGALREEKGVREVIEAFCQLPPTVAKNATLCLFGQVRSDLEDEFPGLVASLRRARPDLQVQVENRFLSERELHNALKEADVVLAPYLQSEGSSGVIGHAARYQTPVVGPNSGLVGALIEEYSLGVTAEAANPSAVAEAVTGHIQDRHSNAKTAGMRRYVEERTPTRFAETIFGTILGSSS
jgi:glycosyltransferase involved in cell wall biosynthesis